MNIPIASNPNRLLSVDEVAAMLGVRVQTLAVWRSSKRHDLLYIKVGHNVRYRLSDVEAWLVSRTVGAVEETK
jgi:excisionase family DNA binding protein